MLLDLYEVLVRTEATHDARWGRGVTAYGLSQHLNCSPKKAKAILHDMERFNFMWSQAHQHRPNVVSRRYYLNAYGRAMLSVYREAGDNPSHNEGQMKLEIA